MSLTFFYYAINIQLSIFALLILKQINTNMKNLFLKTLTLVAFISFTSCGDNANKAETKEATDAAVSEVSAVTYIVNTEDSSIEWKGFKPTGTHHGTIAIKKGELNVNDGTIESGKFAIDMHSIYVQDIPEDDENHAKLTGHLKSADFFDVEVHSDAMFEVTGIETVDGKTMLSGNLTIKDTSNNISFPVTTDVKDDTVTLTSETFTIDRSKWNVKFGSKSFFDNLGDKFINDGIELKVILTANKA